jgi:hypothetical protein
MTADRDFVRDVAKQVERRRRRRKLIWYCAIVALVICAALYLRCGRGWGTGGSGDGDGTGTAARTPPADARTRCSIRVAAAGITVDGKPATRDAAVAACNAVGAADVVVTGDAREGTWSELRSALDAAHVQVFVRGP